MAVADPFTEKVQALVVDRVGSRVVGINETTRSGIANVIEQALGTGDQAMTSSDIASAIRGLGVFDEARAEVIARTEIQSAFNAAALTSYTEYGVSEVQAIDGDYDEVCADRNGRTFSVADAMDIEDHPNGTLDWVPIVGAFGPATPPATTTSRIAPEPSAPLQAVIQGSTQPVSSAFESALAKSTNPKITSKLRAALSRIDKTFTDGKLPEMPRISTLTKRARGLQGRYLHGFHMDPIALEYRADANLNTVFHEIAHFIDHQVLGLDTGEYGSRLGFSLARDALNVRTLGVQLEHRIAEFEAAGRITEPVAQAIINSRGYSKLVAGLQRGGGLVGPERKWALYAVEPREAFARAMAQYLTKREGGQAVIEMEKRIYLNVPGATEHVLNRLADQWEWDDFQPIDDAITKMLSDLGWLV